MCDRPYLQYQYTCTIVYAHCDSCYPCKGHIEVDLPAEWVFSVSDDGLRESVQRRWQVIKADDSLRVTRFLQVRDDVTASTHQIGA
jgi:hypothetical protein